MSPPATGCTTCAGSQQDRPTRSADARAVSLSGSTATTRAGDPGATGRKRGRVRLRWGRARSVLRIAVLVDAESHCPLACQHVRLLCDDARLKIGRNGGFAWFRKRSDESFPDRFRDGTPREPSASPLDHVAQL